MPSTVLGSGGQGGLPEAQVGGERCKQARDCNAASGLSEAQRKGTSLGQWRWILVGFQEEMTSKLMSEQWVFAQAFPRAPVIGFHVS